MRPVDETPKRVPDGFKGEIAGLGLSDVIQLSVHNRFSGCITVQYADSRGLIFFRDGEIIHAEQGEKVGEDAFCNILAWPAGQFSLQPNVATTRSTIQKGWQHLLLEAHRLIDERRAGRRERLPSFPPGAPTRPPSASAIVERLRRIPGVAFVVVQGKDGVRVGDNGHEADVLAGQSAYLAMVGKQLGSIFRVGEVRSAAVQGTSRHLVLFAAHNHYVSVLVHGESQVRAVDAEVRRTLAGNV